MNFHGRTAGIIGTGKIGAAWQESATGFGMNIISYDVFENPSIKDFVTYVTLDELLAQSDLISLHCPADGQHLSPDQPRDHPEDERRRDPRQYFPWRSGKNS